ncbi:Cytochrome P450 [Raineyella antarctica]|uniref:Cytochrome P450 n=1 Tax=Raineyella antarctica TaxID=1577474 RepID=A0A1G6HHB2_9ACTN|nr:cytochrome P450 [Raineyella antarctica]SDB93639.1 Cytochrome P450 [Raineyella antarctica]
MTMTPAAAPPGPNPVLSLAGIARHGFLGQTGRMWREHGDTFELRLGIGSLVMAIHPDDVREVSLTQRRSFDKRRSYDGARKYLVGDGLVASTGELWRRQRKLMAPLFTPRGIQHYAQTFLEDAHRLEERWDGLAASGEVVEMGAEMMELTASIIVRTMFGTAAAADIGRLKQHVETMIRYTTRRMGPHLPDWVPTPAGRAYRVARDEVHGYLEGIIAQRQAVPTPDVTVPTGSPHVPDLLDRLMAARDDEGRPMSAKLLRDESITVFFAGHETTARTLAATWAALAANPEVAARLHAELDDVLGDRPPTVEDLRRLPYTLQVIKEVLRLYPAAPFYVRDAVGPARVGGYEVAEGTPVMLSPYYTHRHPDFWEDPERFDPDRFTPAAEAARHPQAYHPFATGERVCIGNHFALLESHLLLAVLARRFAPALVGGPPRWAMEGVLVPVGGLPMRVLARH